MNLTGKYQQESFYIYEKNLSIFYFFKGFSSSTRLTNLWRARMDGFGADRFHSKCDNQGKTLTVVKTKSGYIMGGYTAVPWTSPQIPGDRNDSTAFLFTLVNPMRRPLKLPIISSNSQYATRHVSNNGPIFGNGFDLFISNNCYYDTNSYSSIRTFTSPVKDLSGSAGGRWMLGSPNSFSCEDIEVFRVDE